MMMLADIRALPLNYGDMNYGDSLLNHQIAHKHRISRPGPSQSGLQVAQSSVLVRLQALALVTASPELE